MLDGWKAHPYAIILPLQIIAYELIVHQPNIKTLR